MGGVLNLSTKITTWLFWLPSFFLDTIVMMTIFGATFGRNIGERRTFPRGYSAGAEAREFLVNCSDVRVISTSSWFKNVLNFGWWSCDTSSKHQTELLWLDNLAQANRSEDERLPRSIFDSIYLRCFRSCLGTFRRQAPESSNSAHCYHIFITLLCSRSFPWRQGNSLCR